MIPPLSLWFEKFRRRRCWRRASGVFAPVAAIAVVRFRSFFQRMHPPALAFSFSAWCVTLASILYLSVQDGALSLHAWLIIIFLSLTVPVTTILRSRTELFRRRNSGDPHMLPPLSASVPLSADADDSSPTPH